MSKEAMKLALGKIKSARDCHPNAINTLLFEAEEILEEALAEPDFWEGYVPEPVKPAQQEPVASVPIHPKTGPLWAMTTDKPDSERLPSYPLMALYTSPPAQRKPLTDEEISKCWGQVGGTRYGYVAFARAIETAHNIKENT
jgi:hypothetical protein